MNEYAILVRLLTRGGNPIGASVEDMLDALGLPEDIGRHTLFRRLGELSRELAPLGLEIKHNPVYGVFHVDTIKSPGIPDSGNSLPDRLAATLLIVLTLAYQEGGWVSLERVQEFRRKSLRGVVTDLRELEAGDYVELDQSGKRVRLGPKAIFEVDYERFFSELTRQQS
ncbi:MAG: hypothetical protein ACP6KW_09315 [Candidatus Thorarchaeota archaeon]